MTDKELRTLDEILTNLEIWSTWNKTFANEMIMLGAKIRNLLADRKTEPQTCDTCRHSYITCRFMDKGEPCHYEPKDEPQTEKPKIGKRIDKPFRAVWLDDEHKEIGTPQTERSK